MTAHSAAAWFSNELGFDMDDLAEKTLSRLIEQVEHKYYGKYRGIVVDNNDPENLGRLKVKVPSVLGNDVVTGWAMPCLPYGGAPDQGFFFIPEVEAGVWIEFEAGDLEYPIWVGTFWSKPGGAAETPKPADTQSPPTRKIIRTSKGSCIEIEDKDSEEVFIIKYADGSKNNTVTMDKDGIVVVDANENKIIMNQDGMTLEDKNKNKIELNATAINVFPATQCTIGSGAANPINNFPACLFTGAPHAMDGKGHATVLK